MLRDLSLSTVFKHTHGACELMDKTGIQTPDGKVSVE